MRKEFTENKSLLFSLVFLICFFIINFLRGSIFNSINQDIDLWAASINNGFFTIPAIIISITFDTAALAIISLAIGGLLFIFHYRRYGLLLLSSMAGAALLVEMFKMLIRSSRPLNEILRTTSYSFPSGHVTSTVVFFGILTYFVWKHWHTIKTKVITCVAYVFVISVVSFDRIYLNVHWFSDVIGAIFLGSFWLAFCIYVFNRLISSKKQDIRR
ncbi:MAG TPA: phosphatase PAP2 family protein [Candidatus Sulfotelmatobacter sp.]|nr:phosphatase PAP2 family protein [Candidatus Sulfotelmatobacter sp.]